MHYNRKYLRGFTLIELSIVLVIIGLIAGGILGGRTLINAAAVRSQLSQVEQIQQATKTFQIKYGYLPGDIAGSVATQFGLAARGSYRGLGDGNGALQGNWPKGVATGFDSYTGDGECLLFWRDLADTQLFKGQYLSTWSTQVDASGTQISLYYPAAKIAASGISPVLGTSASAVIAYSYKGNNYLALTGVGFISSGTAFTNALITVSQASAMDGKIDDGLPQSGNVFAASTTSASGFVWMDSRNTDALLNNITASDIPAATSAITGSDATCYDNANTNGRIRTYSITQNSSTMNCALSFSLK